MLRVRLSHVSHNKRILQGLKRKKENTGPRSPYAIVVFPESHMNVWV